MDINPSNLIILKKLSINNLDNKDLSNAYIYINKLIKIDPTEIDVWNLFSRYYSDNGDFGKYYECIIKELENSKLHINSFLLQLLPKSII